MVVMEASSVSVLSWGRFCPGAVLGVLPSLAMALASTVYCSSCTAAPAVNARLFWMAWTVRRSSAPTVTLYCDTPLTWWALMAASSWLSMALKSASLRPASVALKSTPSSVTT